MARVTKPNYTDPFDPKLLKAAQMRRAAPVDAIPVDAEQAKVTLAATPLTDKTLRDDAAFGILVAIITNQGLAAGIEPLVDSAYQVADEVLKRRTV